MPGAALVLAALARVGVDGPMPPICDALVNGTLGAAPICLVNRTRVLQGDSRFALAGGVRLAQGVALGCEPALCALEFACASGDIELEAGSMLRGGNVTLVADALIVAPSASVSASALGLDDSPDDYYGDRHVQGAGYGGVGGSCLAFNAGGASYGDATAPAAFGSGRHVSAPFKRRESVRGGGVVAVFARSAVQLDGALVADGEAAVGTALGGGSGGTVIVRLSLIHI